MIEVGNVAIIVVLISGILGLNYYLNFSLVLIISTILIFLVYFLKKNKNIFVLIIPFLFLIRISFFNTSTNKVKHINNQYISEFLHKKSESLLKKENFEMKSLFNAVTLGESSNLDRELKEKFSYTGIYHLLAISGLDRKSVV